LVVNQFGTLTQRVVERLLVLDEVYRHGWIDVTQEALGAMTGGSRQAVNRVLADAAAAGLIAVRRGAVRVLDPATLAARHR
jgi:CRP-like cAMP-binding protein